jgi:release factor glutamine methyltransferase
MALSLSDALVLMGRWLLKRDYQFITITPLTHAQVNARNGANAARGLRDVFGWSRPFSAGLLPADVLGWLRESGLLDESGGSLRSKVRFSTLGGCLYAHSAYPTTEAGAVFFGPALIEAELARNGLNAGARILDIGCGAGPGGIAAALAGRAFQPQLLLADINPRALEFARANALLAGLPEARFQQSNLFESVEGRFDLIVANPPYLVDAGERTYRHGGGALGSGLSVRIVREGLPRLAPGGRLVLYTGAPIVDGRDPFREEIAPLLRQAGGPFSYREIDPDVFGEELDTPAYAGAERIAAVALVAGQASGRAP